MKVSAKQLKTYHHDSTVSLVKCGKEYFDTLETLIDEAEYEIQFQTYIYDPDETGESITNALIRAASRGVKIFLVVDSFGSGSLNNHFANKIREHKIYFRKFSPLFSRHSFQVGRRLHHKIVVVDEQKALIGGINIADKYYGRYELPWLDFAVLISGNYCKDLARLCRRIERKKITKGKSKNGNHNRSHKKNNNILVRFRQNDWVRSKNQIRQSYKAAIRNSEKSITIASAYFIPGVTLRRVLRKAAKRGVEIKLLLSGESDVPFIKGAQRFLYSWLLHIHVRVFEYSPSILHGKAMMVDGEWVTIGSYNINHLSDYSSIELNADVYSKEFASSFNQYLEDIIRNDSMEITEQMNQRRKYLLHAIDWFSYQFVRLNMSALFFFITKRGKNRLE